MIKMYLYFAIALAGFFVAMTLAVVPIWIMIEVKDPYGAIFSIVSMILIYPALFVMFSRLPSPRDL